jgi:hypothetical protein
MIKPEQLSRSDERVDAALAAVKLLAADVPASEFYVASQLYEAHRKLGEVQGVLHGLRRHLIDRAARS